MIRCQKKCFSYIKEDKQKKFIEASISEFTSKSFEQVSVNSIVRKAGVARGSFYNYFESLESLFTYIFQSVEERRLEYGKKLINEVDGDYFKFVKKLFEFDYDLYTQKGHYSLFKNYIHFIQSIKKGSLKKELILSSLANKNQNITDLFQLDQFDIKENEFLDIMEIIILIMINTFFKSDSEHLSKKEIITLFNRRISIIEKGLKQGELE